MNEEMHQRTVRSIVDGLFADMNRMVTAYDANAIKVRNHIEGTAFFPGGSGLWRGLCAFEPERDFFPANPVMFIGHNFDKVSGFENSIWRGIEQMNGSTWRILRRYIAQASIDPLDCFFTNVFVGLQPLKSPGLMKSSELFKEQCRDFLVKQIEWVRPRALATLGAPAAEQLRLLQHQIPSVSLAHPMYACAKGSDGAVCAAIVADEAAKLRKLLRKLDTKRE